ncbi:MAG TPA: hypothetical protein VHD56_03225 [Tepidisphaeraceae bacterium]|nr:hypothetical protein [Tepidisphaeraceae bacterium]
MSKSMDENLQTLADAVGRNAAIVLSLPSAGIVRNHKTRFIGETEKGIWIEIVDGAESLLKELHEKSHPAAVSFTSGTMRLTFAGTVLEINEAFVLNATTSVPAVLITRPTELKGTQRRNSYRVTVPQDSEIRVRTWIIAEHAVLSDQPLASTEIKIELRNLSTGGMGVRLSPKNDKPLSLVADQRLRIELCQHDLTLILDGRLRSAVKTEKEPSKTTGVVFKRLEGDLDGRQKLAALTKIIGELQREEVRRVRFGTSA